MWRAVLVAVLLVVSTPDIGQAGPFVPSRSQDVTARLGISAGDAIADVPLGTGGDALRATIPLLWATAEQLGVTVVAASVGQGFWSDGGVLDSERDLDLIVRGHRDPIELLAGMLGRAWNQSTVYVWYPTQIGGRQATATIPLPGDAHQLNDDIYASMLTEISGGAHVKYAGAESLIFIANTDDEPDELFYQRMTRLVGILGAFGVETGQVERGRADVTLLTWDHHNQDGGRRVQARAAANRRSESGMRSAGLLPEEEDHVQIPGGVAKLGDRRRDLAAMGRAVVDQVSEGLPQRLFSRRPGEGLVAQGRDEVGVGELGNKHLDLFPSLSPRGG
jgi:hypothetical protein